MKRELPMGLRFSIVSRAFKKHTDELLKEKELTGVQLVVLGQLGRLEDEGASEIRQRDLEQAARMSHPTMTEILKRLERKGFVEIATGAQDRRCKSIRSTPRAAALRSDMDRVDREVFERLCVGLEPEELSALLSALNKMMENAANCGGKGCEC